MRIFSRDIAARDCAQRILEAFPRCLRFPSPERRNTASYVQHEVPGVTRRPASRPRTAGHRCDRGREETWQFVRLSPVRRCAQSRAEVERLPCGDPKSVGWECSTVPVLHVTAPSTYITSYRCAYGHWRTTVALLHRPSTATFPQPRTFRPRDPGLTLHVASRAGTSNRLNQTVHSFSTERPLAPHHAIQRDEPRRDKQSLRLRSATHPTIHAVVCRRTEITNASTLRERQRSTTCVLPSQVRRHHTSALHFKIRM